MSQSLADQIIQARVTEISTQEKMATEILSKNRFLNKYTDFEDDDDINTQLRFEVAASIIRSVAAGKGIPKNFLGRIATLRKEFKVSKGREGRKEMTRIASPLSVYLESETAKQRTQKRTLKERILRSGF